MKTRIILLNAAVILCLLAVLSLTVAAQKRRTSTRKTKRTTTAVTTNAPAAATDIRNGAEKVSIQIKNLTKFIYVLGTVAQGIQDVDNDIKAGRASQTAIATNTKNKQSVVATIRNLRAGLAALEVEFQSKPALRPYLTQLGGISNTSGIAEDQATSGQFLDAGKTLLQVVEKLSDTLAALP